MIRTIAALTLAALLTPLASAQPTRPPAAAAPDDDENRLRSRRTTRVVPLRETTVASPNGKVTFVVLPNAERLSFRILMGDTPVIEPSAIKLLIDGYDLGSGVSFKALETYEVSETYPWHGAHRTATDRSRGAKLTLTNDLAMQDFVVDIRAFDDGAAYRLIVPGASDAVRTPEELSEFVVPGASRVWFHDLDGHYEAPYEQRRMDEIRAGQWAGPPVTFELPHGKGYGVITEANLVNYSGLALEADGRGAWLVGLGHRQPVNYPYELRYGREEARRLGRPASVTGTITTPWRVVLAAHDLDALVNSDVLPNLCPPSDPKLFAHGMDTPWVEPGMAVWKYLDGPSGPSTVEMMKEFSRLGGQLGAKYHILEGFAYRWSDDVIKDFVDYSKQHGVRVLFWRHSNVLRTPDARREFFDRLQRLGIAGAKIDFFDHEAKETIDLYEELARMAAERQLVLDFHGSNKPTGRLRTWPNVMLHEGVRGLESSSLRERARHETIIPFTRYLAGPADYTTMIFGPRRADSTWAHQIAALATLHSPMLTIAAHPRTVLEHPAADVIRSIRPVWDETRVLPSSRIGELSVFARRSGDMWMLAIMSARLATSIEVPLSFLGEGEYRATYVRDDKNKPDAVVIDSGNANRGSVLTIDLAPGGGFVGRFVK